MAMDTEVSDDDIDFTPTNKDTTKRGKGGRRTVTTRQEFFDDPEVGKDNRPTTFAALFDAGEEEGAESVVRVRVSRKEPDEGMLGYIEDMDATEQLILEKWGGGSLYRLEGLNSKGRIARVRTIKLAGEPIFMSEVAEAAWRKQKGLPPKWQGNGPQLSTTELIKLMEEREEKRQAKEAEARREEREREERRRQEEKEREEARRREERESEERRRREEREWKAEREKEAREWEERKRRDDEERDRRRREEDRALEQQRLQLQAQMQQQQQQFMQTMLQLTQSQANQTLAFVKESAAGPKTDPTESLLKGVQLVMQIKEATGGEGGEKDLLTTVVENLPAMLNGIGNAATKVVREVKGTPSGGTQPALPAAAPSVDASGALTLPPGKVSAKFTALINKVAQAGGDPEKVLDTVADRLLAGSPAPAKSAPAPAAAPETKLPVIGGANGIPPEVQAAAPPSAPANDAQATAEQPGTVIRMKFKRGA